jgi:photosystem II stability/assembly factor-like uncharacterized protein
MTKNLLYLFFFFTFCLTGYAQEDINWKWSHQKPQGNALRWVKMWDSNNWYALGHSGTFIKTSDGGQTWMVSHKAGQYDMNEERYKDIYAVHFFDMNTGLVAGQGGHIARTTDGGFTWEQIDAVSPTTNFYNFHFINSNTGYLVGTISGRLMKTTNGGLTWTLNTALPSGTYYDVYSPDGITIIVSSTSGNIRRSTDGGLTWNTITGASSTLFALRFIDANIGWAAGSSSKVRYTTDGGLTWTDVSSGLPSGTTFYDIDFNGSAVYLTGNPMNIYKTTNMGSTWVPVDFLGSTQPWTTTYYSTSFFGDKFVTVGGLGLVNSAAGINPPAAHTTFIKSGNLYDIWAESTTGKVIAVGSPGSSTSFDQIIYSDNGGETWTKATVGNAIKSSHTEIVNEFLPEEELITSPAIFRAIDMVSPLTGYIVGQFGAVYKTTNGGVSWDSVVTPIGNVYLYDVDFVDENTGWVVGAAGNCWKTTDGGVNWSRQAIGLTSSINSISMVSATHGWFGSGSLYYTTNGGTTWGSQTTGMGIVYAVSAVDVNTAYIVSDINTVGKTTNGGINWTTLILPPGIGPYLLYGLDFRGEFGVISGAAGKIATTYDGGNTWLYTCINNITNYGARIAVQGNDTTSVFVVGSSGMVLKNANFLVPVELTSFSSSVNGNRVTLSWVTATETNNSGFAVERSSDGNFEQRGYVQGSGTTTAVSSYSYSEDIKTGRYIYRLKQIDYDGSFSYSDEISVEISAPYEYTLEQNYPNPFNPSTSIKYQIPAEGFVTINIYDINGGKISSLINQVQKAGRYEIIFDASDFSSGIYFYKMASGSYTSVRKMILVK